MANETEKYYAKTRGEKYQYIGFMQNGQLLSFDTKSHARYNIKFEPENDGVTFHLSAAFTDSLRSKTIKGYF